MPVPLKEKKQVARGKRVLRDDKYITKERNDELDTINDDTLVRRFYLATEASNTFNKLNLEFDWEWAAKEHTYWQNRADLYLKELKRRNLAR